MAYLVLEGFDCWPENLDIAKNQGYVGADYSGYVSLTDGRFGGKALYGGGGFGWPLPSIPFADTQTVVAEFSMRQGAAPDSIREQFGLLDGSSFQVELRVNLDMGITLTRNGTTIASTANNVLVANFWHWIGFKVTIGSSAAYELKIDGVTVLSGTDNTQATANAYVNRWRFMGSRTNTSIDDLTIKDTTGSENNDFQGEQRIISIYPNAVGDLTTWTPSTGANNWDCVNETVPDTGDYVSTATPGNKELYNVTSLPSIGVVTGIKLQTLIVKDDATARTLSQLLKSGGTLHTVAPVAVPATAMLTQQIFNVNPITSAAFTGAEIDSLQIGHEAVS